MFENLDIYEKRRKYGIVVAILVVVLFLVYFIKLSEGGHDENLVRLDEEWNIKFRDTNFVVPSVMKFKVFKDLRVGDSIIYTKKFKENIPESSILRFRTYHSVVHVWMGKKLLYEYGSEAYESGELVGNGYHYVNIPPNLKGKKIKISVMISEKSASNPCSAFEIIHFGKLFEYFSRHAFSVGIGIFLTLFGLLSILSGLVAMNYSKSFYRLVLIGSLAFLLGTWTMCYMKVMQVFSMNFALNTKLEYISLYLMPIPLELLIINMRRNKVGRKKWFGIVCVFLGNVLFFVVSSVLQFLNVLHYPETLGFFHVYIFVGALYLIFSGSVYDHRAGLPDKIFTSGIALFAVFALVDVVRYNLQKFYSFDDVIMSSTWLPIGSLLLILLLIISYFVYLYDIIMDRTEKEVLKQLAYRDALTGLYNRAKCDQIFNVLNKGVGDYAIVSIDMNGLKKVNDSFGHTEGDRMICLFAEVFKKAFSGVGTTIRMGGDEFIAIVRAEHLPDLDDALDALVILEREFSINSPIALDASYGYAVHRAADDAMAMDIYRMADAKMYAMKVKCHKSQRR